MAKFSIKYQTISQKTKLPTGGTMGTVVTASSRQEARQVFLYKHPDNVNVKYKVVAVVKSSD